MFFIWLITVVMASYFKGRFFGLTGDTYGAVNEVSEVGVLVVIALLLRLGLM